MTEVLSLMTEEEEDSLLLCLRKLHQARLQEFEALKMIYEMKEQKDFLVLSVVQREIEKRK